MPADGEEPPCTLRGSSAPGGRRSMTVPATTFSFAVDGQESGASVDELHIPGVGLAGP